MPWDEYAFKFLYDSFWALSFLLQFQYVEFPHLSDFATVCLPLGIGCACIPAFWTHKSLHNLGPMPPSLWDPSAACYCLPNIAYHLQRVECTYLTLFQNPVIVSRTELCREHGLSEKLSLSGNGGWRTRRSRRRKIWLMAKGHFLCFQNPCHIEPIYIKKRVSFWERIQLVNITEMAVYVYKREGEKREGRKSRIYR